jgi:hypothetical protein
MPVIVELGVGIAAGRGDHQLAMPAAFLIAMSLHPAAAEFERAEGNGQRACRVRDCDHIDRV